MGSPIQKDRSSLEHWLIIDTDAGIDDAVAICLALKLGQQYGVMVKLISCVQGNCKLEQVVINVAKCREACGGRGCKVPKICVGSNKALNGTQVAATFFHGADGLGNVTDGSIADPIIDENEFTSDAIECILEVVDEASKRNDVHLTLLALGPLTNIAKVMMKQDKDGVENESSLLMNVVEEFVLMGGCGNAQGNITRVAEFNIYNDAEAADYVFSNWTNTNVVVASWEYTVKHALPWETFDEIFGLDNIRHNEVGKFLSKILHHTYGNHEPKGDKVEHFERSKSGAVICDPCALIYCLDKETASSFEQVHIEVECKSELTRGMTVVDWGSYDGVSRSKNVKWLIDMDNERFLRMLRAACIDGLQ